MFFNFRDKNRKRKIRGEEMTKELAIKLMAEGKSLTCRHGHKLFMQGCERGYVRFMFKSANSGDIEEMDYVWENIRDYWVDKNKTITLDGKEFEISEESFNAFKKQFRD